MIKNKKIISLSPYNPFHTYNGVTTRIHYLNKELAKNNEVWLVIRNEKDLNPTFEVKTILNTKNKFLNLLNPIIIFKIAKIIKQRKIDYLLINTFWPGIYGIIFKIFFRIPFILDEHNAEFVRYKRTHSLIWPFAWLYEMILIKFAYRVFCVSEIDRDIFIENFNVSNEKFVVVPNGVDHDKFKLDKNSRRVIRDKLDAEDKVVLYFNGHMNYKPNIEALEIIAQKIGPALTEFKDSIQLWVIGGGEIEEELRQRLVDFDFVKIIGFVERIEDYLSASDVCLVPLKSGSGTRLKIIEALCNGKVILSTEIGAEGLNRSIQEKIKVRSIDDMIRKVKKYIETRDLGQKSLVNMITEYHWDEIVKDINI